MWCFARLALVVCVVALVCSTSAIHAAISLKIESQNYAITATELAKYNDYVVQNAGNGRGCILMELQNGLDGLVSFTYSSSKEDVGSRGDLMVSVHRPNVEMPSTADVRNAEAVVDTKVFNAIELHAADARTRKDEDHENGKELLPDATLLHLRSMQMRVPSQMYGTGPSATSLDGNYAVCFGLLKVKNRPHTHAQLADDEVVTIHITEAAASHRSTNYIAPTRGRRGIEERKSDEEKEIAQLLKVLKAENALDAKLAAAMGNDGRATKDDIVQQLRQLQIVYEKLQEVLNDMDYFERRYERMRMTAESTFTRIWMCMIILCTVMSGVVWFTFHYTKGIIIKKKLI